MYLLKQTVFVLVKADWRFVLLIDWKFVLVEARRLILVENWKLIGSVDEPKGFRSWYGYIFIKQLI